MVLCPVWGSKDWFALIQAAHNRFMTITHPNGSALKTIVVSHAENEIRAIVAGSDDVLVFGRHNGTWFSEDIDPVALKLEWQCSGVVPVVPSEADCLCSKALAAHLIHTLYAGCDGHRADLNNFHVLSPEGARVAIYQSELALA